jgi:methylglutaconyl-CoA hydratase
MQMMPKKTYEENVADTEQLALLLNTLYAFPKPTIALAHGTTLGGGLGLLASCDITLAAENAHFCFSEVKMGLTPSVISPYILAAIGARMARYYFLTGEKFNAMDARRIMLIHQVIADDQLHATGVMLANNLIKNGPQALTEAKNLIATVHGVEISEEIMQYTAEHLAAMRSTAEAQEGLKAFLEKREAKWSE